MKILSILLVIVLVLLSPLIIDLGVAIFSTISIVIFELLLKGLIFFVILLILYYIWEFLSSIWNKIKKIPITDLMLIIILITLFVFVISIGFIGN